MTLTPIGTSHWQCKPTLRVNDIESTKSRHSQYKGQSRCQWHCKPSYKTRYATVRLTRETANIRHDESHQLLGGLIVLTTFLAVSKRLHILHKYFKLSVRLHNSTAVIICLNDSILETNLFVYETLFNMLPKMLKRLKRQLFITSL